MANFGDILDEWDRQTARAQGGKKSSPKAAASQSGAYSDVRSISTSHPLNTWLDQNGVYDKDAGTREQGEDSAGERRRRLLRKKPDALIDLHGLTQDEAWRGLEVFFENSRREGLEKVLIIHGKGNHRVPAPAGNEGVLRELARRFIEACSFAGESGYNPAAGGGTGATWVILKKGAERN
jgi:DNA-nicking Smr family endonuclease